MADVESQFGWSDDDDETCVAFYEKGWEGWEYCVVWVES